MPALPVSGVTLAQPRAPLDQKDLVSSGRKLPVQGLRPVRGDRHPPTPPPPTAGDSPPSSAGFPVGCCGLLAKVNLTSGRGRMGKAVSPAPRPSPAPMSVGAANSPAESVTHEAGNTAPPPPLPAPTAVASGAALGNTVGYSDFSRSKETLPPFPLHSFPHSHPSPSPARTRNSPGLQPSSTSPCG